MSQTISLAFVDDYAGKVLGHHPDFLLGLAEASLRVTSADATTRIYCPSAFLAGRSAPPNVIHEPFTRRAADTPERRRERMNGLCRRFADPGGDVLVNLYLDESDESFPVERGRLQIVQTLHRPVEFAEATASRRTCADMRAYLERIAPDDLFVVHTRAAHATALEWLPAERLLRLPWPAASEAELAARFSHPPPAESDAHALLIGDARPAKGVHELLSAIEGGPLLRIVGQQPSGFEDDLRRRYPNARVEWETGWVPHGRLSEAIQDASVIVFPYLETFRRHGGASGALAQALTHGKPMLVSTVLADQLPASRAIRMVEPGDVHALREAVDWTLANSVELHRLAARSFDEIRRNYTYESYVERMLSLLAVDRTLDVTRHR